MKNFALKFMGLGFVLVALFFASCEDTPIDPPLGPEATLVNEPGFLDVDSDVIINEGFAVRLRLSSGDADLQSVEIAEGATKLDAARFSINNGALTSNNPFLITGADVAGATYDIAITPSGTEAVGDVNTYTFTVTDTAGETASVDIVITTAAVPGTPLSMSITGVLFNQAGPAGTGGLDLDTGTGTGSAEAGSEIRDLGLDCTQSPGTFNWLKQIGTINGAVMVRVDASQLENFSFDNVDKTEPIVEAYNTGMSLSSGTSTNCGTGAETTVTNVAAVSVDDLFVVFANDNYYLIRIDNIDENNTDNGDSYELSIKY